MPFHPFLLLPYHAPPLSSPSLLYVETVPSSLSFIPFVHLSPSPPSPALLFYIFHFISEVPVLKISTTP
jgi:hypothetical protein